MYKNFNVAVYCATFDLELISSRQGKEKFNDMLKHIKVSKIYLETFRNEKYTDKKVLDDLKKYFSSKNIQVSGGITFTKQGRNEFESFCYSNELELKKTLEIVEYTARNFDEVILDDFFFTNCKCGECIDKKGDLTWSQYRLDLMASVSQAIVETARKVNPSVTTIIKYPNWYDSYQEVGYNTEKSPQIFDNLYTGTETRHSQITQQVLPPYNSYFLMRYMDNIKSGHNLGGWFDTIDCKGDLNAYLDQLYLTLLGGAKEVTLFSLGLLLGKDNIFVPLAGHGFNKMDQLIHDYKLPSGLAAYKPHASRGENHIYGLLGMLGMPIECYPDYPDHNTILLTSSASFDLSIIDKIKKSLSEGKRIIMTSGLLRKIDFEDIANIKMKQESISSQNFATSIKECGFQSYSQSNQEITLHDIHYSTNDVWQEIVMRSQDSNVPVLLKLFYDLGEIYILNLPNDPTELYHLPVDVLNHLRTILLDDEELLLYGPSKLTLFKSQDRIFIRSFISHNTSYQILIKKDCSLLDEFGQTVQGKSVKNGCLFDLDLEARELRSYQIVIKK